MPRFQRCERCGADDGKCWCIGVGDGPDQRNHWLRRPAGSDQEAARWTAQGGHEHRLFAITLAARSRPNLIDHTYDNEWRATRDVENLAGELIAGAATLKFSVAYLRDYGQ